MYWDRGAQKTALSLSEENVEPDYHGNEVRRDTDSYPCNYAEVCISQIRSRSILESYGHTFVSVEDERL